MNDDDRDFNEVAFNLGLACGGLSNPKARERLVALIAAPEGAFTRAVLIRAQRMIGEVLAAADHDPNP